MGEERGWGSGDKAHIKGGLKGWGMGTETVRHGFGFLPSLSGTWGWRRWCMVTIKARKNKSIVSGH